MNAGLQDIYSMDSYVYFVDSEGTPISWNGFRGNANADNDTPYLLCPVHTKAAWEDYDDSHRHDRPDDEDHFYPDDPDEDYTYEEDEEFEG